MPPESPAPAAFSHREIVVILLGLALGLFLSALDQSILGTVLPRISADLGGGDTIAWVVSGYLLANTAVTPVYGKLSDIYGRKRMLQTAILLFTLGSLLCALAQSMLQLILFRILQGVGGGGLMSMAFAVIGTIVPPRQRGRYQGYFSTVWGVSSILGPALGGLFADYLDWRWVFWINLPLGLVAWLVNERTLRRLPVIHRRPRIDYPGAVLIVAAASCLLLAMTLVGQTGSWRSPEVALFAGASLLLFLLTAIQECRHPEPILPPRLFRIPTFVISNSVNLLSFMGLIAAGIFMPIFFQLVYGVSAARSGVLVIPFLLIWTLSSLLVGQIVARTGRYKRYPIITLALATVGSFLMSRVTGDTPLVLTLAYSWLLAAGSGAVGTVTFLSVQNAVPLADIGVATASLTFTRNLGGAFGVALFATLLIADSDAVLRTDPAASILGPNPGAELLHHGSQAIADAPPELRGLVEAALTQGFQSMFLAGAVIAGLAFVAALFVKELPLRTSL
jgi:EmrB/QacA subfamily drug resistance transporter